MTHDPLCPGLLPYNTLEPYPCQCRLIAKVREDEQEKGRQALEAQAKRIIRMADMQAEVAAAMAADEMLDRCIAAVEAFDDVNEIQHILAAWTGDDNCTTHPCENCRTFGRAVSAINALWEEKP